MGSVPESISNRLQSPETESERLVAWAELQDWMEENPGDEDAINLYLKYRVLDRDFSKDLKTPGAPDA